jgi:5-methylphenazine-1-carboxylate 1-monooxygenase
LAAYEAERRPATSAVVLANRGVGPEKSMEIVADRAPNGFTNIDDVISQAELEEISNAYKRTAGFDPALLNDRPSLSVPRRSER